MNDRPPSSLDLLGIKPIGEAVKSVADGTIKGTAAFLSRICLPAAKEFGLLLKDQVRNWRANNLNSMLVKAERIATETRMSDVAQAHPRIVATILEQSSWQDDDGLQELWAGLLAASCEKSVPSDSNLVFVQLLSQITPIQARILEYACVQSRKFLVRTGLVSAHGPHIDVKTLQEIAGVSDLHLLDLQLDHLRSLELIHSGINLRGDVDITPTALAIHFFAKCKGSKGSGVDYFNIKPE